jgi:hypothetical protein
MDNVNSGPINIYTTANTATQGLAYMVSRVFKWIPTIFVKQLSSTNFVLKYSEIIMSIRGGAGPGASRAMALGVGRRNTYTPRSFSYSGPTVLTAYQ